ncbi:flagellar hook protein FlgE [uncultured Aquincola sp.]|uniref:flagellar hook protein FlgE n=1 Tax=uncultured Aquincola sp. TaxID=886556 RepID=UPI0032B20331|tara:strand:- start:662 stop:1930 length:1269 start_codon:yes stop_codon:yes gene_type:complete
MSFQQGLSGLNASSKNLDVIGNNIANANTYGAKTSRAEFADMYATALNGTGANNVGIGVNLQTVAQQFTQGNITSTENAMDLSINGGGFFQVTDGRNPVMYTRNGQFKVDREGNIVNNDQLKLMGYPADGAGVIQPGLAQPLKLPTAGISPQPTTTIDLEMNLDARLGVTAPTTGAAINFSDAKTYNNATSQTLYDAKGQEVAMTYYFQKAATPADTWNVFATANGTTVAGTAAAPLPVTTLNFSSNGGSVTNPVGPISIDIPASTNVAGAATLPITGIQLDLSKSTQYGSGFRVTDLAQDGYAAGTLSGISVEDSGIVMARYSNGESKPVGRLELANFRNTQGLQPLGGNLWARTFASGDPIVNVPGEGTMGKLQSGALEESNVDLTGELVNMITAQRIYQANAQTIKTQDQVLQTLVNLR